MGNLKDINYGIGKYLVASDASGIPDIGTNRKNLDLLNFKVAVNNAYALYNFKDGMIDAYQDQTGVDTATSTGEIYDSTNKTYNTSDPDASTGFTVTGALQTFTVPAGVTSLDIKCFGGGEANGGGFSTGTLATSASTVYAVVVGEREAAGSPGSYNSYGYGGGGRAKAYPSGCGLTGVFTGSSDITFTSTSDQARAIIIAGGSGGRGGQGGSVRGEGGGASGGTGIYSGTPGGTGGTQSAVGTGYSSGASGSVMRGGQGGSNNEDGGAGGGYYGGGGSSGQPAAGGGSGYVGTQNSLTSGLTYGGASSEKTSDSDYPGSDVAKVLFKYSLTNDISLVSNTQTAAQADPTEGRLMLYEEDVDACTPGTDIKGYVSRDGGTTWSSAVGLTDDGYYETFNQGGIDSNTALMLHMDGANDGTTFTDNAPSPHTVVTVGNAKTVTTQKKFGTASGYFDGTGDYLTIATSSDNSFVMGTGNFTVDFWAYDVKVADADSTVVQIGRGPYGASIGYVHSGGNFVLYMGSSASGWDIASAVSMGALPGAAWAHYALVRNGNTWTTYKDGTQVSQFSNSSSLYVTAAADVQIGRYTYTDSSTNEMEGYVDEVRISKGVARWTADFTPPTAAYSTGAAQTNQRILSGSVDISGQPAGSNMKYKVTTHNSKSLKLHGASLLWA